MKLLYLHNDLQEQEQDSFSAEMLQGCATVDRAGSVEDALSQLSQGRFDAILMDISAQDDSAALACRRLALAAPDIPVLALVDPEGEALAVEAIAAGAQDYLIKSRIDSEKLEGRIRAALARRVREVTALQSQLRSSLSNLQAIAPSRDFTALAVWAAAVLPSGEPDRAALASGKCLSLSRESMTVEFTGAVGLPAGRWVAGLEHDDGVMRFACVEAAGSSSQSARSPLQLCFLDDDRDLFCDRNLRPAFDARANRYTTGLRSAALAKWTALGVLHPMFFDRVVVCPQCSAVSTVRSGCRMCGSARLDNARLMHHFACAYVAHVAEFETEGRIVCPKCRTRDLVVGADFEYIDGPFQCQDCSWSDASFEWVARCLDCQLRFPIHQAVEQELIAYHVERLDPLAFIAAS